MQEEVVAGLADDVRLLARLRSPSTVRTTPLPSISAACAAPAVGTDAYLAALLAFVDQAIEAIDDEQLRRAAREVLGSGGRRWSPLTTRGAAAGSVFHVSYDGFRKKRTNGTSLADEVFAALIRAMVAVADGRGGSGAPVAAPAAPTGGPPEGADRGPRVRWALVAAAVLVAAVVAFVSQRGGDDGRDPGQAVGLLVDEAAPTTSTPSTCSRIEPTADRELAAFAAPFRRALAEAGSEFGCPTGRLHRWQELVVQDLRQAHGLLGAIVARTPDEPFVLTNAEYGGYVQIYGKKGIRAQDVAGYPVSVTRTPTYDRIDFSKGVVLIGEDPYSPMFWMPGTLVDEWEQRGGERGSLGLPTSNPLATPGAFGLRTDFHQGYLVLAPDTPTEYVPVPDPGADLPKDRKGKILRHDDGTTWYVDDQDVRHWIPTGDVYECKGGAKAQIDGVPGYAITTLKKGPPATC